MEVDARSRSGSVLRVLALLVAVVVAFLGGVLVERLRFDSQRTDMLRRYDRALRQHQQQIIWSEQHSDQQRTRPATN